MCVWHIITRLDIKAGLQVDVIPGHINQWAHTCTENVLKTRFQDVQNINSEDVDNIVLRMP